MTEADFRDRLNLELSKRGFRLFVNARGRYQFNDRWVTFGLGPNGASDLIGFYPLPNGIAVFVSIETKMPGGETRQNQVDWIRITQSFGAFGAIVKPGESIEVVADEIHRQLLVRYSCLGISSAESC
jgi:hypothetical protein